MFKFDASAFHAGIALIFLLLIDSKVVALFAKAIGMKVVEVGIFFGNGVTRRILGMDWKLGFIPLGNYLKIKGMGREMGEAVEVGDFDYVPLWKRASVLLIDKVLLALLLVGALAALPGGHFWWKLRRLMEFWEFVFGGSQDAGRFPFDFVGELAFPVAAVASWMLFVAILPIGGSKTQHLLRELVGRSRLRPNVGISILSMLAGLALLVFLVFRLSQYIHAVSGPDALGTWLSFFLGILASAAVVWGVFLMLGKPVSQAKSDTPSAEK